MTVFVIHGFRAFIDVALFGLFLSLGLYEIPVRLQGLIFFRIFLAHGIRISLSSKYLREVKVWLIFGGASAKASVDVSLLGYLIRNKVDGFSFSEILMIIIVAFIFCRNIGESWSFYLEGGDDD